MKPIPIDAAKHIAMAYGYDQVIIIARAVGKGEHVTTYGVDRANCEVAATIGDYLKYKVMCWAREAEPASHDCTRQSIARPCKQCGSKQRTA